MNDKIYFFITVITGIYVIWLAYKHKSVACLISSIMLLSFITHYWPLFLHIYVGFSIVGIFAGLCAFIEFFKYKSNGTLIYGILLLMFGFLSFVLKI